MTLPTDALHASPVTRAAHEQGERFLLKFVLADAQAKRYSLANSRIMTLNLY